MTTDLKTLSTNPMDTMEYRYDALHRIREAQSSTFDGTNFTANNLYDTNYTYDGNGNLQNLTRNGNGGVLHNLSYQYADTEGPNRLSSVNNGSFGDYTYDKIGNLLTDSYDNIDVEWTVYGKVREVTTANGPDLVYLYDAGGNRLAKIRSDGEADFYIRDASGNVMSVYEKTLGAQYDAYAQKEVHLYGSSRLGIRKYDDRNIEINGPVSDDFSAPTYMRTRGQKLFEFSNHLGNTLVTLTDQKLGTDASTDGMSDYYAAVAVSTSDYYPFGMAMGARTVSSDAYRYGFNGKENDTEWGERMIQDYGFRLYNPTIAKFLSVDPLAKSYPMLTPYQFASNTPIAAIDVDGLEADAKFERQIADKIAPKLGMTSNEFLMETNPFKAMSPQDAQFAFETALGFTPAGWVVDVKDLYVAYSEGDGWGIFFAGVGFIPLAGDLAKNAHKAYKSGRKISVSVEQIKYVDDISVEIPLTTGHAGVLKGEKGTGLQKLKNDINP